MHVGERNHYRSTKFGSSRITFRSTVHLMRHISQSIKRFIHSVQIARLMGHVHSISRMYIVIYYKVCNSRASFFFWPFQLRVIKPCLSLFCCSLCRSAPQSRHPVMWDQPSLILILPPVQLILLLTLTSRMQIKSVMQVQRLVSDNANSISRLLIKTFSWC
jgi:hypothetical protein